MVAQAYKITLALGVMGELWNSMAEQPAQICDL